MKGFALLDDTIFYPVLLKIDMATKHVTPLLPLLVFWRSWPERATQQATPAAFGHMIHKGFG